MLAHAVLCEDVLRLVLECIPYVEVKHNKREGRQNLLSVPDLSHYCIVSKSWKTIAYPLNFAHITILHPHGTEILTRKLTLYPHLKPYVYSLVLSRPLGVAGLQLATVLTHVCILEGPLSILSIFSHEFASGLRVLIVDLRNGGTRGILKRCTALEVLRIRLSPPFNMGFFTAEEGERILPPSLRSFRLIAHILAPRFPACEIHRAVESIFPNAILDIRLSWQDKRKSPEEYFPYITQITASVHPGNFSLTMANLGVCHMARLRIVKLVLSSSLDKFQDFLVRFLDELPPLVCALQVRPGVVYGPRVLDATFVERAEKRGIRTSISNGLATGINNRQY